MRNTILNKGVMRAAGMVILMLSSQQKETENRQVGDAGHQNKEGRKKVSIFDEIHKEKMSEEEVDLPYPVSWLRWHTIIRLMKPRSQL